MLDKESTAKTLNNLIHRNRVVAMDDLFRALDTQCRMSVFRRLKEIGYRTSYTHCGRYYTLESIPKFDERGLWFYQDVGFSKSGTLKATIKTLVESGSAGFTHEGLEGLLHIRVHSTLWELVRENAIGREKLGGTYLYVSPSAEEGAEQLKRQKDIREGIVAPLPGTMVIEILVEALLAGRVRVSASLVVARLSARGHSVSVEQVEGIFTQYGVTVEKKTARASRHSKP